MTQEYFFLTLNTLYSLLSKLNERKFSTDKKVLFGFLFTFISCLLSYMGASVVAQLGKNLPAIPETQFVSWVRKIPWRRKWQPTPVFLPGKSQGQRSLVGYSPWGHRVGHDSVTKAPPPSYMESSVYSY